MHTIGILSSDEEGVNDTLGPVCGTWYNVARMAEPVHGSSAYRVTLFFGPEPVEGESEVQACVFNVKKRSWKAGIHVSVEIYQTQLSHIFHRLRITDRIQDVLTACEPEERQAHEIRVPDVFAQAIAWCKLDLCLAAGMTPEHQRILATEWVSELEQSAVDRSEYVAAYILSELDIVPDCPSF